MIPAGKIGQKHKVDLALQKGDFNSFGNPAFIEGVIIWACSISIEAHPKEVAAAAAVYEG